MPDTVGSILQHKGHHVWSVSPGESVLQAIRLMADKGIGALLVIADEKLVGIISERDYARKVVLEKILEGDTSPRHHVEPGLFRGPEPHRGRMHENRHGQTDPSPARRSG